MAASCTVAVRIRPNARQEKAEPDGAGGVVVRVGDTVIYALGTKANPIVTKSTPGLELNKWGYIVADDSTITDVLRAVGRPPADPGRHVDSLLAVSVLGASAQKSSAAL